MTGDDARISTLQFHLSLPGLSIRRDNQDKAVSERPLIPPKCSDKPRYTVPIPNGLSAGAQAPASQRRFPNRSLGTSTHPVQVASVVHPQPTARFLCLWVPGRRSMISGACMPRRSTTKKSFGFCLLNRCSVKILLRVCDILRNFDGGLLVVRNVVALGPGGRLADRWRTRTCERAYRLFS